MSMSFLHIPSQRVIHNPSPRRVRAYRRSSNFVELTDPTTDPTTPMQSFVFPSESTKPDSVVPEGTDVPEGNVSEVLAWAGDNPDRIRLALEHEKADKRRVTLIAALELVLDGLDD